MTRCSRSIDDAQAQIDEWVDHYNHDAAASGYRDGAARATVPARQPRAFPLELEGAAPDTTDRCRRQHLGGCMRTGRSASRRSGTWPGSGWPARPSSWSARTGSCRSSIAACSSPPMPGAMTRASRPLPIARGKKRPVIEAATPRPSASSASVTRKVDSSGNVSFAGTSYRAGNKYRRRQVQVAVVDGTVEISIGEELIRVHPIRHDRTREHGALANPGGRPRRINAAS